MEYVPDRECADGPGFSRPSSRAGRKTPIELWLRGGLRIWPSRGKKYHSFAPPRVELGGNRAGVSVFVGDEILAEVDSGGSSGVYEIPLSIGAGAVQVRALRDGLTVAEESFTLTDVAHAGSPTRMRGFLDGFGNATTATSGWCGAWVEAVGVPRFCFPSLAFPVPEVDIASDIGPVNAFQPTRRWQSKSETRRSSVDCSHAYDPRTDCSLEVPETDLPKLEKLSPSITGLNTVSFTMNALALQRSLIDQVSLIGVLVAQVHGDLDRLASLQPGNRDGLVVRINEILAKSAHARTDVGRVCAAANLDPEWIDVPSLIALLEKARTELQAKLHAETVEPFRRLGEYLEAGQVGHHLPKMREKLNVLRRDAANELRTGSISNERPLPGPTDVQDWLEWFWSMGDGAEQIVDALRGFFPSLADFLELVTREQWKAASLEPAVSVISANRSLPEQNPLIGLSGEIAALNAVHDSNSGEPAGTAEPLLPLQPHTIEFVPIQGLAEVAPHVDEHSPTLTNDLLAVDAAPIRDFEPQASHASRDLEGVQDYADAVSKSENRPPVRLTSALPLELASFDQFQKSNWITGQGACQPAPWLDVAVFNGVVTNALFRALEAEQYGRAKVFAAAAQQLGSIETPTPEEVETWARLWFKPRDAVGLGMDGVLQLRLAAGEGRLDSAPVWKFRLCLEALRPSRDLPLGHGEEEEWVDATEFHSGAMRQMLLLLLRVGRATDRPTDDVRRALKLQDRG